MTRLEAFALAVWGFVVGDDWRTALGVGLGFLATAVIAEAGSSSWWVLPIVVAAVLGYSLRRASR